MPLAGYTESETTLLAAAYLHTKEKVSSNVSSPPPMITTLTDKSKLQVDWEKVRQHLASASVGSITKRMQVTMKKDFDMEKALSEVADAPAGGINKKSPNKVTPSTPKKAKGAASPKKGRKKGSPVKSEAFVAEEEDEDAGMEGGEVQHTEVKEGDESSEV